MTLSMLFYWILLILCLVAFVSLASWGAFLAFDEIFTLFRAIFK